MTCFATLYHSPSMSGCCVMSAFSTSTFFLSSSMTGCDLDTNTKPSSRSSAAMPASRRSTYSLRVIAGKVSLAMPAVNDLVASSPG